MRDGSASSRIADWALQLRWSEIPEPVREAALNHSLDAIGCGLGARRSGEAEAVRAVAAGLGGPEEATVIGGGRLAAPNAALANGALMHALDFDDTHAASLVHATVAVLPAALAVAEETGAGGEELLAAVVAGLETVTRLGAAVRHGFHARGFHATSVCGTFASALVAARLLRLDRGAAVNAIGIAGSFASGSLEFLADGSSTKQLHPGWAAHAGVLAARLARAGATGPARILEGASGLYRSYAGQDVDPLLLSDGLGDRWETVRITIKPYPACQLSHASLDALLAARVQAAEIESMEFEVPEESASIVCRPEALKAHPRTAYDAKFSLPWCAAALAIDGALSTGSFAADRIDRPEVMELAARITHRVVPSQGPAAAAPGRVRLRLRDGSRREGSVPVSRGGPEAPLSREQVMEKFRLNAGKEDWQVGDLWLELPRRRSLDGLTAALGGRGAVQC